MYCTTGYASIVTFPRTQRQIREVLKGLDNSHQALVAFLHFCTSRTRQLFTQIWYLCRKLVNTRTYIRSNWRPEKMANTHRPFPLTRARERDPKENFKERERERSRWMSERAKLMIPVFNDGSCAPFLPYYTQGFLFAGPWNDQFGSLFCTTYIRKVL